MPKPAFRLVAKNKSTKEFVDIGVAFRQEDGRLSFMVDPGTIIKVSSKYDKDTRSKVNLVEPIYIKPEEYFLNLYEDAAPAEHPVTSQIRKTFAPDAPTPAPAPKLPF